MSARFNPGDVLTIATRSYQGRKFTVVESNAHRTVLDGGRKARRVLVKRPGCDALRGVVLHPFPWAIHEDDGERNRGRPCTVDAVEPGPKRQAPVLETKRHDTREEQIRRECEAIADMLAAKNADYGDSALSPLRVFSKADAAAGLRVRIDDKLSRLARGRDAGEDTVKDLIGYLVLLRIAEREDS